MGKKEKFDGNKQEKNQENNEDVCEKCGRIFEFCECNAERKKRIREEIAAEFPWLPEPIYQEEFIKCNGGEVFHDILNFLRDHIVYQKEIEYYIDATWIMHTYFMPEWNSTMYLGYVGSGNDRGKSLALDILGMLSYRGVRIAAGTNAGFKKLVDDGATLLIDQAENLFYENKRKTLMYSIFTSGYIRDFKYIQLDVSANTKYDCRETFGAKAFNQQEDGGGMDNPIEQRTFVHYMLQGEPKITDLKCEESVKRADVIFRKLHYLKKNTKIEYEKETGLLGRTGKLLNPLIYTCRILNLPKYVEEKIFIYALELQEQKRAVANNTMPAIIVNAIQKIINSGITVMSTGTITNYIKTNIEDREKTTSVGVGRIVGKMGLKQARTSTTRLYDFTEPENILILQKTLKQYNLNNSIENIVLEFENSIVDKSKIDFTKNIYERFISYKKYLNLIELVKKQKDDAIEATNIKFDEPMEEEEIFTEEEIFNMNLYEKFLEDNPENLQE